MKRPILRHRMQYDAIALLVTVNGVCLLLRNSSADPKDRAAGSGRRARWTIDGASGREPCTAGIGPRQWGSQDPDGSGSKSDETSRFTGGTNMSCRTNRRGFLGRAALPAAGWMILGSGRSARSYQANEKLNVAVVGVG